MKALTHRQILGLWMNFCNRANRANEAHLVCVAVSEIRAKFATSQI